MGDNQYSFGLDNFLDEEIPEYDPSLPDYSSQVEDLSDLDFGAAPAMGTQLIQGSDRNSFLTSQLERVTELEKQKAEALKGYSLAEKEPEDSWGSVIGNAIAAILPMALGGAIAGSQGAAAGALGAATNYQQSLERAAKQRALEKEEKKFEYQSKAKETEEARKTYNIIKRDEFNAAAKPTKEEKLAEQKYIRQGLKDAHLGYNDDNSKNEEGLDSPIPMNDPSRKIMEEKLNIVLAPDMTPRRLEKLVQVAKLAGENQKPVEEKTINDVASARTGIAQMERMISTYGRETPAGKSTIESLKKLQPDLKAKFDQINKEAGTDNDLKMKLTQNLMQRLAEQQIGGTDASNFLKKMTLYSRQLAKAYNSGALTDRDVEQVQSFFLIDPLESTDNYFARLKDYVEDTKLALDIRLKTSAEAGRTWPGLDNPGGQNQAPASSPRDRLEYLRKKYPNR